MSVFIQCGFADAVGIEAGQFFNAGCGVDDAAKTAFEHFGGEIIADLDDGEEVDLETLMVILDGGFENVDKLSHDGGVIVKNVDATTKLFGLFDTGLDAFGIGQITGHAVDFYVIGFQQILGGLLVVDI